MLEQKSSSLENIRYMQKSSLSYYRLRPLFLFFVKTFVRESFICVQHSLKIFLMSNLNYSEN